MIFESQTIAVTEHNLRKDGKLFSVHEIIHFRVTCNLFHSFGMAVMYVFENRCHPVTQWDGISHF